MAEQDSKKEADAAGSWREETLLTHAGLSPESFHGFVNPPVVRASTVLFENADKMLSRRGIRYPYGLMNTPTIEALTNALTALEGSKAAGTVLVPSGLAAVTLAILVAARPGKTVLVPDNSYAPTRRFCDETLPQFGARAVYYDPLIGGGIAEHLDAASVLVLEAPGSHTFEMPDMPPMIEAARKAGVISLIDNTWATPLIYRPLEHGIDLAVYAGTKYQGGHSDLMIGSITANAEVFPALKRLHLNFGLQAGTEEIWLTLRGLRTMGVRLDRHQKSALEIATWLKSRSEVVRVLHPALPDDPGHAIWKRDFGRSTGLFAFVLRGEERHAKAFLNALKLFGLGYSWGGFESLAVMSELKQSRTVRPWTEGPVIRLHIGLENVDDLKEDVERGFAAISSL
jgi:cystathionine beta-lyase